MWTARELVVVWAMHEQGCGYQSFTSVAMECLARTPSSSNKQHHEGEVHRHAQRDKPRCKHRVEEVELQRGEHGQADKRDPYCPYSERRVVPEGQVADCDHQHLPSGKECMGESVIMLYDGH